MTIKRRVAFMGTPQFVVPVLEALCNSEHEVVAVYSQPPRVAGRGQQLQKSPVHEYADSKGIPVYTPKTLKTPEAQAEFKSLGIDVAIVAAYGLLLPKPVLDTPTFGCINIHVSLLPRWRGAAPIQFAILKGDNETGVTIMKMDVGMDTGPMIVQKSVPITNTTTSRELYDSLFKLGAKTLIPILDDAANIKTTPQPEEGATHAPMLKKEDGKIDWSKPAIEIDRQIRAFDPWPGTYTTINGKRLKVLEATPDAGSGKPGTVLNKAGHIACGSDVLKLLKVQPDGGKPMDFTSALNGNYINIGDVFS